MVTPAPSAATTETASGLVLFESLNTRRQCSNPEHTATETRTQRLSRVTPEELKRNRFTGTVNYLVLPNEELRLAEALPIRSSCGRKLNGHAHLSKVDGKMSKILASGELELIVGNPVQADNDTGTFKPEGDLSLAQGQAHKNQAISAIAKHFGPETIINFKYISYCRGGKSTAIRYKTFED